jgi:hypothetical protein
MVVTKGTKKQGRGFSWMSRRPAAWLAWSLWTVSVALIALSLVLDFVTDDVPLLPEESLDPGLAPRNPLLANQ